MAKDKTASLYRPPAKHPGHSNYAIRAVIPDEWKTIPKDLKPFYDALWEILRPVRETNTRIDVISFAIACQNAGLGHGFPTVEPQMDFLCRHWCRYCSMEDQREEQSA